MANFLERFKISVGLAEEEQQPKGFWETFDETTTLSRTKRLWGFGILAGFGVLFMFLAMILAWVPTKFAILYTLGSCSFFASTFFLMGPLKQLKSLTKQYRIVAVIAYVVSLGLTIWASFWAGSVILVILFFIIQLVALGWYILTYIPYGQKTVGSMFSGFFGSS